MRKVKDFTVKAEGRDKGKTFVITEMPAYQSEKWAWRALGAMARSGLDIPPQIADMGMAGVLAMGLKAILGADFAEAEPLLDELMGCVKRKETAVPDGRPLVEDDIEEPATISMLRSEVLEVHTGFSVAAYLSQIWEAAGKRLQTSLSTPT